MTTTADPITRRGIHRAWWVAAATMAALIAAAGFRSSTGALLEPLENDFGWSRATTSGAVSLNLMVYGLTAPFAAALMERFGIRRVVAASLALVALGSGLTQYFAAWMTAGGLCLGAAVLCLLIPGRPAGRRVARHRRAGHRVDVRPLPTFRTSSVSVVV